MNLGKTFFATMLLTAGCIGGGKSQTVQRPLEQKPLVARLSALDNVRNAPRRAGESLVQNPQGTYKDYALSLYMYVNQLTPDWDEYDLKNKFVVSDDGKTVWIRDFFMGQQTGWVKGEMLNNKIRISAGQYVADAGEHQLYLFPFVIDSSSNPSLLQSVNLVKKEGAWTMEGTDDVYWGLWYYTSDTQLALTNAYGHKQSFREVVMKPQEVPADATHEQYLMSFNDGWRGGEERKVVDVARHGDDIYISGLSFDSRSDYAKGTVKDGEAVFESDQCVAGHDTYWLKLTGADGVMYRKKDNFAFTISASGTMTLKDGVICTKYMFDEGNLNVASDVKLVKYAGDVASQPADPYALKYKGSATLGNQFTFVMPHKDVDGQELNPDLLYYRVYLDGEPYTFKASKYTGLQHDMDKVPYNYYDTYTFNDVYQNKYKLFYLADEPWNELSVESVYIVGGEERVSAKRATVLNPSSGVAEVGGDAVEPVCVRYTNQLGQEVVRPLPGQVYLQTIVYKSGRKETRKVAY